MRRGGSPFPRPARGTAPFLLLALLALLLLALARATPAAPGASILWTGRGDGADALDLENWDRPPNFAALPELDLSGAGQVVFSGSEFRLGRLVGASQARLQLVDGARLFLDQSSELGDLALFGGHLVAQGNLKLRRLLVHRGSVSGAGSLTSDSGHLVLSGGSGDFRVGIPLSLGSATLDLQSSSGILLTTARASLTVRQASWESGGIESAFRGSRVKIGGVPAPFTLLETPLLNPGAPRPFTDSPTPAPTNSSGEEQIRNGSGKAWWVNIIIVLPVVVLVGFLLFVCWVRHVERVEQAELAAASSPESPPPSPRLPQLQDDFKSNTPGFPPSSSVSSILELQQPELLVEIVNGAPPDAALDLDLVLLDPADPDI